MRKKRRVPVCGALPEPADYDGPVWPWLAALVRRGLWNGVSLKGLRRLIIPLATFWEICWECRALTKDYPVRRED